MQCVAQDMNRAYPKEQVYTALEDLCFDWYPSEIELAKELWKNGMDIRDMAKQLRPINSKSGVEETFLLLMDLLMQGRIKPRKGNMFGKGIL